MLNSIAHIIPKIPMLLDKEDEELQLKVMDQIPEFCDKIMKNKDGYKGVVELILPRIQNMIHFLSKKLSDKAVEVMLQIARSMNEEDRGKHILTYVLRLGHDEEASSKLGRSPKTHTRRYHIKFLCSFIMLLRRR